MKRFILWVAAACALCAASASIFSSCSRSAAAPDSLTMVTLYGPASYFEYRDTVMGYDYDIMEGLASRRGVALRWVVAASMDQAIAMLDSGTAQVLAADVPDTRQMRRRVLLCGPRHQTEHVLVQPPGDTVVVDLELLAGRTVYVEKNSKAQATIERIDAERGLGITVRPVDPDSTATEDVLAAVARGDIHLAIVDSRTAMLNQTYYPDLNITMALGEPQLSQWAVAKSNKPLARTLNSWCAQPQDLAMQDSVLDKYFRTLKRQPVPGAKYDRDFENGYASPFDHLFKQHAAGSGWDWRLLAAQGWTESRFDSTALSWAGAAGVMQIMPNTARHFGLKRSEATSASRSIETAIKVLDAFDRMIAPEVPDPIERQKFVMASYNAGAGHVLDAIRLAKKYGLDPQVWDDNVEKAMLMKMNRKYYRDPVVRHGYSRGRETVDYVDRIWSYYADAIEKVPA